jgi:hypothetical protein
MVGALPWLLVGLVGLVVSVQENFVLPWLLYLVQYKIIFISPYTISIPLSPLLSKLGRQPCWVACLLGCVSGYRAERRVDKSCSIRDQSGRDADISSIYQGYSHNSND